jgi:hypothetical protein
MTSQSDKKLRSDVWKHFSKLPDLKAKCNHCQYVFKFYVISARHLLKILLYNRNEYNLSGSTTSNLVRHLITHKIKLRKNVSELNQTPIPTFSQATFRQKLIGWIICDDLPFTIAESERFRDLYCLGRLPVSIPTADTIKDDIMRAYKSEKNNLKTQGTKDGRLSIILEDTYCGQEDRCLAMVEGP